MSWADVGQWIAQKAPLLGTVVAGQPGAAIGSIIAAKFGADPQNPADLLKKMQADLEAGIKLSEIESTCEIRLREIAMQMAENELKYEQLNRETDANDRANAREREKANKDNTPAILAYLLTAGVFIALYYLFHYPVPKENKDLINAIITAMTTVWIAAMAYYHGSSAGSRIKDFLIAKK
jgi:hypothetical protein